MLRVEPRRRSTVIEVSANPLHDDVGEVAARSRRADVTDPRPPAERREGATIYHLYGARVHGDREALAHGRRRTAELLAIQELMA